MDFSNHVFIITGAASGIGQQLAIQAAGAGAKVIALDINETGLHTTAASSNRITVKKLDVSDEHAITSFASETLNTLQGEKLVLINNAGVALVSGTFSDTSLEDIQWLMNINFWGVVRMTKAFYPYFIKQNSGHIVNVSSAFGLIGFMYQSAYCPSKFAVRGFTETLRMELLATGIKTHSVHPGGIDTGIVDNGKFTGVQSERKNLHASEFKKTAITTSEEAARVILNGIIHNKERILIGSDARAIDRLARLFPSSFSSMISKQLKKKFTDHYI